MKRIEEYTKQLHTSVSNYWMQKELYYKSIVKRFRISISAEGRMPIPVSGVTCLLLGPGTNVTHAAIRIMADSGCMVIWCGEGVGRLKKQPKELEENGYLQKQFRYSLRYTL